LGWHRRLPLRTEAASFFSGLASDVVVDHVGRIDATGASTIPHFISLLRFLESGRGWVKISGPYYSDIPPHYTSSASGEGPVEVRPDRLVLGRQLPHPTLPKTGEPKTPRARRHGGLVPDEPRAPPYSSTTRRLYGFEDVNYGGLTEDAHPSRQPHQRFPQMRRILKQNLTLRGAERRLEGGPAL